MKKQLISYDPVTHKSKVCATITLEGGKVVFDPPDAPKKHTMLKSLVDGRKAVEPKDGKPYWEALDDLRGTYYEVKIIK